MPSHDDADTRTLDGPAGDPTRRGFLAAAGAGLLAVTLAGCGGEGEPAGTTTADPAAGFPLRMRHRFGTTTLEAPPQRVVAAGFNDADFLLALGTVPLGVADFIGTFPEDSRPWAQRLLGGRRPPKVTDSEGALELERIAGLRPDAIVYYNYLEEDDYRRLSRIAPTVVEPEEGTPWPQHTRDVGRALGKEQQAQRLVDGVRRRFARARREVPQLSGKTVAVLFDVGDGGYFLLEPTDARFGLFRSLGLRAPEKTGSISDEQVELLDQDLIAIVGYDRDELMRDPLFWRLRAVREGRVADLGREGGPFAGALGFDSPLSLPYALDVAVPRLARAVRA